MPCYHPYIRIENRTKPYKTQKGTIAYKTTIERANDITSRIEELRHHGNYKYQVIPCGNCIGCRLEYSREWANRGYLEAKCYKNNYFVTITYNEENIKTNEEIIDRDGITYTNDGEWKGTLVPKDLTDFIKRLRRIMEREYNQKSGIRYMACGEYGEQNERPHYHIIFFNLNLPTDSFYNPKIINEEIYYQNKIIEKAWKKGISNISEASWNNIAYTARYITKKLKGKGAEEYYATKGQEKEFLRVSRMPGIGKPYYDKYKKEIYQNDEIIIKNKEGVISCKPPHYFDDLYEKEQPERMKKIKRKREKEQRNREKIKDEKTSKTRIQQLEVEERTKIMQGKQLRRSMEKGA